MSLPFVGILTDLVEKEGFTWLSGSGKALWIGAVLKYEEKFNMILFTGLLQELVIILDTDKEAKSKQETMMKKHTTY